MKKFLIASLAFLLLPLVAAATTPVAKTIDKIQATGGSQLSVPSTGSSFLSNLSQIPVAAQMQQEVPSGTVNGSNTTFTLAHTPVTTASLSLYVDGILQFQTSDYTLSTATITMIVAPALGQKLIAVYSQY